MSQLKSFFLAIQFIVRILLRRPFGHIIYDISNKYDQLGLADLRRFEKLSQRCKKADLDIGFLRSCKLFGVIPKFLMFKIPYGDPVDQRSVQKRLLRSATQRRIREKTKLHCDLQVLSRKIKGIVNSFDFYLLSRAVTKNVQQFVDRTLQTHEKKLSNLTKNRTVPFCASDTIINMSDFVLSQDQQDILKNGLKFSLPPRKLCESDVFTTFEMLYNFFKCDLKDGIHPRQLASELQTLAQSYVSSYQPSLSTLRKYKILQRLKKNPDIIITKPDKGDSVVIMNRSDYRRQMGELISDPSKFSKIDGMCGTKSVTLFREGQLQRYLLSLKNKGLIDEETYRTVYPVGSVPSRLYGLPKMHKRSNAGEVPPFRPIVSSIGSYNYQLAKYLNTLLTPLIPQKYSVPDTFKFVKEVRSLRFQKSFLVSFDIKSLFTNVPVRETTEIALDLLFRNNPDIKMSRAQLQKLFLYATSKTHFLFDGEYFDQTDGLSMGSPLGPTMANIFMGFHEDNWLQGYDGPGPVFYKRYIDDIICIFEKEEQVTPFLNYLNSRHPNIEFTVETEEDDRLPFLDTLVQRSENLSFEVTTYRKPTYTGLLTNF